ncbi:uncharacterized protein LOC107265701 [Cephus cinctus]|uniref:Uncharacterized protein LOC107265701 n=1 Tax=Cephus cinctus TaxID=211228 RepID=A0AAJ7FGN4_CEPCN|nr:uncharacterized protein LOC107265701 [Cephus cinctus]
MAYKFVILAAFVAAVNAGVIAPGYHAAPAVAYANAVDADYDPNPQYSYSYDVHDTITGDTKSQQETRNGDVVEGSYSLIESDGTRRVVHYTADPHNGFNAVVQKEPAQVAIKAAPVVAKYAAPAPLAYHAAPVAHAPLAYAAYLDMHYVAVARAKQERGVFIVNEPWREEREKNSTRHHMAHYSCDLVIICYCQNKYGEWDKKKERDEMRENVAIVMTLLMAGWMTINDSDAAAVIPVHGAPVAYAGGPVPVLAKAVDEYDPHPQYSYGYDVQDSLTGDAKSQYETRNGDVVSGRYSLIEADGTRRVVEYTADPINGFNAVVHREPAIVKAVPAVAKLAAPVQPLLAYHH